MKRKSHKPTTLIEVADIEEIEQKPQKVEYDQEEQPVSRKLFNLIFQQLKAKTERNVARAIEEIYSSESQYIEHLQKLVQARADVAAMQRSVPCKDLEEGNKTCIHGNKRKTCNDDSNQKVPVVSEEDINKMFIDIKALQNVHTKLKTGLDGVLSKQYEEMEKGNGVEVDLYELAKEVSGTYAQLAPYWAMYSLYIQRFETAIVTLHRLRNENNLFDKRSYAVENKLKLTLLNLINKPVQRITKYPILFKALENYIEKLIKDESVTRQVPENIEEVRKNLSSVGIIIQKSVEKVNQKLGIATEMGEMFKLNEEIGKKLSFKLLEPWRRVKSELHHDVYKYAGKEYSDVIVHIFNDIIIASTRNPIARRDSTRLSTKSASVRLFTSSKGNRRQSENSKASSVASKRFSVFQPSFRRSSILKPQARVLTPVTEEVIKIEQLISSSIKLTLDGDIEYYVLSYSYDEFFGDKEVEIEMYFHEKDECERIQGLIETLQKELKDKKEVDRIRKQKHKGKVTGKSRPMTSLEKLL